MLLLYVIMLKGTQQNWLSPPVFSITDWLNRGFTSHSTHCNLLTSAKEVQRSSGSTHCTCWYWTTMVIASNHLVLSVSTADTADRRLVLESHSASRRTISLELVCSSATETSGRGDCFIRWDDFALLDDETAAASEHGTVHTHNDWLSHWVKVSMSHSTQHGHFADILPRKTFALVKRN